jgi:hypothetical protein
MLLKQLLAALARGGPRPRPSVTQAPAPAAYSGTIASVTRIPQEPAVEALYGDDAELAAFMALPPHEQMALIEGELSKLPAHEQRLISEILRKELSRKWIALPGPQTAALKSEAYLTLYGGSAGGGKSDLILGLAITEHRRTMVVRREYDDLSFLTERAIAINGTRDGYAGSPHPVLRTADGRLIEFRAFQRPGDEQKRQGQPIDLLAVDEAAQFLESQVQFLMGWIRSTDKDEVGTTQRRRVVLASNPPLSDEGQWLVRWFAPWLDPQHPNPAKPGELRWYVSDEEGNQKEVDGEGPHQVGAHMVKARSRTFIPARLQDNAYLMRDDDYVTQLHSLPEPLRSAMRDGNFMAVRKDDDWQVIPSEWIRLAQARWTPHPPQGQAMTCISLDPAGGGRDAAAIAHRYGSWFGNVIVERGPQTADGRYIGARVVMERRNNCQVVVDMGGGYGGEVVNVLKQNTDDAKFVIGVKGADASTGVSVGSKFPFANLRAEVWYRFREALDPSAPDKIALPPDPELAADLATPRVNPSVMQRRGVIQIEDKEEIKKRLGRSPDKGDAVVNCLHYGGLLEMTRKTTPRLPTHANVGYGAAKRYGTR